MTSAVSFFDVRDSFQDIKTPKTSTSASTDGMNTCRAQQRLDFSSMQAKRSYTQ